MTKRQRNFMRHTAPQCRAIARRRRNAASASARAFVVLRIAAANLPFASIAACSKSEPTYVAVSTEALNYLPYNLVRFTITDQYGNKARGGGDLEPGAGESSIACCYSLKGANFKVQWTYYDADDWRPGDQVKKQQAEANASLTPTNVPDSIGSRILEIHFYPDHHVELAFPGEMLGSTRLPIVDVSRELTKRYGKQLDEKYGDNDVHLHRRISRTVCRVPAVAVLATAMLLSACDKPSPEPVYGGLSVEGFNYLPYNLTRFTVTDKYGNKASGGGDLIPGSGEGSVSCCYTLKGTEFTVDWTYYDIDKHADPYAPLEKIHETARVRLPLTEMSGTAGETILGIHFYPDNHVEVEFRNDLRGTRILYVEVWDWVRKHHKQLLNPSNDDEAVEYRRAARLAAAGWTKYRLTDTGDLQQYVYFTLLNPRFDEYPAVRKIINETKGKPGAFGDAMQNLSPEVVNDIKRFDTKGASRG
ncbi:DUF3304 domain-containing protein [Burkholderia multivorans]|nr:DUF3304 domain-containing protein [Burkholderia multivorans]MDN8012042.1 DUF3304 domain-containing protein [Burkholderia multivorans]